MSYCTACGHLVEVGRFCTNCGTALADRPEELRPLYVDQVAPVLAPAPGLPGTSTPGRRPAVVWVGAAAGVLVLCLMAWLLGRAASGSGLADGGSTPPASPDEVVQLTRGATASAPETAEPNLDLTGDMVRYEAFNLLDGVPSTTWRMPGDGSGQELTITLPGPSVVTRVGLVNGYAKVDHDHRGRTTNWYDVNRRVLEVEWLFDDGTSVVQHLTDTRRMQTLEVGPVATSTVRLKILIVSRPGGRDFTAISDLLIEGGAA